MPIRQGNENTVFFSFSRLVQYAAILIALLLFSACASQKKKEELSGLGKLYHNTTAKYNGYFNANEILIASQAALEEQYVENYNQILPIYPAAEVDNPQSVSSELDRAIKKVSIVVNLHRQSDWTDDCYLLMGKAQYYKQDYEGAAHTLKYMTEEFTPEKLAAKDKKRKERKKKEKKAKKKKKDREKSRKKAKKERRKKRKASNAKQRARARKKSKKRQRKEREETEQQAEEASKDKDAGTPKVEPTISVMPDDPEADLPDNYFMKHKPAHQEGELWLARTYIERERYNEAEYLLSGLERNPNLFTEIQPQIRVAQAHLYMEQEEYPMVIRALEGVIEMDMKKSEKARYAFILGQLYQRQKQPAMAISSFEKVLDLNPDYDMAFRTKLNLVRNSYENELKTREEAEKELDRMLKDDKNIEYRDQIYFVLAQLALEAGMKSDAISYLRNSLKNNADDQAQRAESYYLLATLYFEQEDFVASRNYYDSTLLVMNKTDDRYLKVESYSKNLKDIATAIETIELQDSLLAIAEMDDQEKRKLAAQLKSEQERKQQAKEGAGNQGRYDPAGRIATSSGNIRNSPSRPVPGNLSSNFFAYNPKSLKKGERDFDRIWGDRPLEDNWRRSNKRGGELYQGEDLAPEVALLDDNEVEDLLRDVPSSSPEIEAANQKIEDALFELGRLFRDRLSNHKKAIESLEELIKRYPETDYLAEAYYYLYLAYTELGETDRANAYRDLISEEFPDTKYAGAILDPNYLEKAREEQNAAEKYYDKTYALYQAGNYEEAASRLDQTDEKFEKDNYLVPKFALLDAMVTAKLKGREAYVAALRDVVAKYPGTEEERRAKEMLRVLGEVVGRTGIAEDGSNVDPDALDKYEFDENELHYVIAVLKPDQDVRVNDMKATISNYNRKYHDLERLRTSSIYLGADIKKPIIVIRKFKNKEAAMFYYKGVQQNRDEFVDQDVEYEVFPITQKNYREVMREKQIDNYRVFFNEMYK